MGALVSIIIPTYNRAHLIGETLNSVLAQTYENWECIVVDDGSIDNTDAIMEHYKFIDSRFRYYHRPIDRLPGGNASRNYGYELSKGEFIQWLDSDDILHPKKLEKCISKFLQFPNIVVSICASCFFEKDISKIKKTTQLQTNSLFRDYVLRKIQVSCPLPLWSNKFLKHKSLFNSQLLRGQEYELYCRLFSEIKNNYEIINEPMVYIRNSTDSITKKYYSGNEEAIASYFSVLRKVLNIVIRTDEEQFYRDFLSIYYRNLLFSIRMGKFKIVFNELNYLQRNALSHNPKYKVKFLKDMLVVFLIKMSGGKLYYYFKNQLRISKR